MLCKECKKELNNLTEIKILFDIKNPSTLEVEVNNKYERGLSMADTINFREALHECLDESLNKIGTDLFVRNTE